MSDDVPAETADALFGPGNWVVCKPCPRNDGHASIHQKDMHEKFEKPTGVATLMKPKPKNATPTGEVFCGHEFRAKPQTKIPWFCELPEGHTGRHGIPRMDRWGPEPV